MNTCRRRKQRARRRKFRSYFGSQTISTELYQFVAGYCWRGADGRSYWGFSA